MVRSRSQMQTLLLHLEILWNLSALRWKSGCWPTNVFNKGSIYTGSIMTVEHIALAAVALGYGACWIGAFDENGVKNSKNTWKSESRMLAADRCSWRKPICKTAKTVLGNLFKRTIWRSVRTLNFRVTVFTDRYRSFYTHLVGAICGWN